MYGTLQSCRAFAAVLVVLFHLGETIRFPSISASTDSRRRSHSAMRAWICSSY